MRASAVAVQDAATVMLVRDAGVLEVSRHGPAPRWVFPGGAHGVAGGRVDPSDGAGHHRVVGGDRAPSEPTGALDVGGTRDRAARSRGDLAFTEVLDRHDRYLDLGVLHPCASWITPKGAPRRGDLQHIDPTRRSLLALRRAPSAAEPVAAVRRRRCRPHPPRVVDHEQGWHPVLTTDAQHRADDATARFVLRPCASGAVPARAVAEG